MAKLLFRVLILECALASAAAGQSDTEKDFACYGNLANIESCLTYLGVPLTKNGLMSALHSKDWEIQSQAADELAFKGIKDAIPDITALLDERTEPGERINLAAALAQLGDERGVQVLRAYCVDPSVPIGTSLHAAASLVRFDPNSCPQTLIAGLQDDTFRVQALGMIPDFKHLTPDESAEVRTLLLKSLGDEDDVVRVQAAEEIRALQDESDIAALESALAAEHTSFVREAMQYDLDRMQGKRP